MDLEDIFHIGAGILTFWAGKKVGELTNDDRERCHQKDLQLLKQQWEIEQLNKELALRKEIEQLKSMQLVHKENGHE